jgi:ketosteroid isomerase-like protein
MSQEDVNLARRGYEALATGDMERVLELIDPDVQVEVHTGRPDLPETHTLHGHEGFLENLRQLDEVFEDVEVRPEEFIEVGEELVVPIYTAGRGRASGIRVENRVTHIWTIRDGKATRFRVFPTTEQALEAVGPTAPGEPA